MDPSSVREDLSLNQTLHCIFCIALYVYKLNKINITSYLNRLMEGGHSPLQYISYSGCFFLFSLYTPLSTSLSLYINGQDIRLYTVSKFTLAAMVYLVAVECFNRHVRVNCVIPGPIDTPFLAGVRIQSKKKLGKPFSHNTGYMVICIQPTVGKVCPKTRNVQTILTKLSKNWLNILKFTCFTLLLHKSIGESDRLPGTTMSLGSILSLILLMFNYKNKQCRSHKRALGGWTEGI